MVNRCTRCFTNTCASFSPCENDAVVGKYSNIKVKDNSLRPTLHNSANESLSLCGFSHNYQRRRVNGDAWDDIKELRNTSERQTNQVARGFRRESSKDNREKGWGSAFVVMQQRKSASLSGNWRQNNTPSIMLHGKSGNVKKSRMKVQEDKAAFILEYAGIAAEAEPMMREEIQKKPLAYGNNRNTWSFEPDLWIISNILFAYSSSSHSPANQKNLPDCLKMSTHVRSAYKGQLTKLNSQLATYEALPVKLEQTGARWDLSHLLDTVDKIRQRYTAVQETIINNADDHTRPGEVNELTMFLDELDKSEERLRQLIMAVKPPEEERGNLLSSTIQNYVVEDGRVDRILEGFQKMVDSMNESHSSGAESMPYTKLEAVKIPSFDGTYTDWPSFKDLFLSLVDMNTRLTKTQKFHYLKTSLTGRAKEVIAHLPMVESSYVLAWDAIKARYECQRTIIKGHIDRFKSLAPVTTPRAEDLRRIYDVATTSIDALDSLAVSDRDPWIIHEIVSKLDAETQQTWSRKQSDKPTWDEFKSLPAAARLETVQQLNLCINCLSESRSSHTVDNCSYPHCKHCQKPHNYWVHDALTPVPSTHLASTSADPHDATGNPSTEKAPFLRDPKSLSSFVPSTLKINSQIGCRALLKTTLVKIRDAHDNLHVCRALLDFGSEISVMTSDLCQRLRLKTQRSPFCKIEGFQGQVTSIKHQADAILVPPMGPTLKLQCQVASKISSDLPSWRISPSEFSLPPNLTLADPKWFESRPVEMLIGAGHEDDIMLNEVYRLGNGSPSLHNTIFGWVVGGKLSNDPPTPPLMSPVCTKVSIPTIQETLHDFFKVEEVIDDAACAEHKEVEDLYRKTTRRAENGQYVVHLPLDKESELLGTNRRRATRQLFHLVKELHSTGLYEEYDDIFKSYDNESIIEKVPKSELMKKAYYMTHRAVVKRDAKSTKVRIVFNCSSQSESGKSLNDYMKIGPVIQRELNENLWWFRRHAIAFICDVKKMYLQVMLTEEHRDLQRFLWQASPQGPMEEWRFRTLCFGNAASPFLAIRTLFQIGDDEEGRFPKGAKALKSNFYVDDCLVSVASEEEALEVQAQLIGILQTGHMELSKWQSNSQRILGAVRQDGEAQHEVSLSSDGHVKALGLRWNPVADTFSFDVDDSIEALVPTKRNILSVIARLYDPLGLVAPVVVMAKVILQMLWKENADWDETASEHIQREWRSLISSLLHIPRMTFPRRISNLATVVKEELHMFSDASETAYGAVIFHVTEDGDGNRCSRMITAKSKVAPVKKKTIPKLELCGATLGARLVFRVSRSLEISQVYCWADAKVVLAQIRSASPRQDVFTKNRVTTIRELTVADRWNYVNTKENPSDLVSRGTTAMDLEASELYWHGPAWLTESQDDWPNVEVAPDEVAEIEEEVAATFIVASPPDNQIFNHLVRNVSNLQRMKRVVLYVAKFIEMLGCTRAKGNAVDSPSSNPTPGFSVKEYRWAEQQLVRWDQENAFPDLIRQLKRGEVASIPNSHLRKLYPFLDSDGILRVGGRLEHLDDTYSVRHPVILPKSSLTTLLLKEMHITLMHAGPQLLLSYCRQKYWPIGGRHSARSIVHGCKKCFVHKSTRETQLMGDLPKHRVTLVRAFHSVSIDCCGPFFIRTGVESRGKTARVDIVVYVCTATKAVHLEVVSRLTTEKFLDSFRRFVARRGLCAEVHTDNGRNFVGAASELKRLILDNADVIHEEAAKMKVTWRFQPPRSPHFGGLVEAAVKSAKIHLKKVIGDQVLNYEEFLTILAQVEAVLNSRPLTVLTDDPADPQPLTPGHFLVFGPLNQLPADDFVTDNINCHQRWKMCQRMVQEFTAKWKLSYLHTLQARVKWTEERDNLKLDDIVILHDASVFANNWTIGRVVRVSEGTDGRVRVVDVRTPTGTYTRAISNISKLPGV
ncbi:uncharacterized protein LOC132258411 [Phlebotomus argentipes]|uniref:uncharacterized protein LOC132258411 n=1 Tax=Phlebotomus argentipes TaxID=94469 RepID=UPI002892B283|nr:uncharacterized protein LOC132258411 [Phlebotomus argentipes]